MLHNLFYFQQNANLIILSFGLDTIHAFHTAGAEI
jgi:hypothetical protein